ncbi:MAG: ABC transporter substrate-binding protein [Alphaproteobacteria bacterium]
MSGRFYRILLGVLAFLIVGAACTNDPYPGADHTRKILYTSFNEAPKSLDPAVAYDVSAHRITGNVYDTLIEFHYLKRPYVLIPGLATSVPKAKILADGRTAYVFRLRKGLLFQNDAAFALAGGTARTREVVAGDIAFQLMRLADPGIASPIVNKFASVAGFAGFGKRLSARRRADPSFARLPAHRQYRRAGFPPGIQTPDRYTLRLVLDKPDPQILYWFALPFTTPVPWEAVQYYDGNAGRPHFRDHPVGTGPYRLAVYKKQYRMVLARNANWYGRRHPEWKAPGATYPGQGERGDRARGLLDPAYVGKPLAFIERIEFRRDKEAIPRFNKFLQGYYDGAGVIKESFSQVIRNDALSPEMARRGIRLEKTVEASIFYIAFNLLDPVVGGAGGGAAGKARARKLRQAMSLAIDTPELLRLFSNGRGVPAQTPIPPAIFGYDKSYRNPYRKHDIARARKRLAEAGYARGIDPATGRPLKLGLDTGNTSAQARLRYQFFVNAWRRIGLDVEIRATSYNQFLQKQKDGAYQMTFSGWIADFPDPENFFFLFETSNGRKVSGGPNYANFSNPRYDALYKRMRALPDGAERLRVIRGMIAILENERPWIELYHDETYTLAHAWMRNLKAFGLFSFAVKYRDIEPGRRAAARIAWNRPVLWPLWVLIALAIAFIVPGVVTFLRERT